MQAAGDAGHDPGEHEARQDHAGGRHGRRLRRPGVVAGREQHPPGPGPAHAPGQRRRRARGTPRHRKYMACAPVERRSAATERAGRSVLGIQLVEVGRVEEVGSSATAKASVVTARNRPRTRSAGRPMRSSATTPPATPATSSDRNRSASGLLTRLAATTAPTPTMANCPRLMWPPQPVSTTSDRPTMPQTRVSDRVVVDWPRRMGRRRRRSPARDVEHALGDADLGQAASSAPAPGGPPGDGPRARLVGSGPCGPAGRAGRPGSQRGRRRRRPMGRCRSSARSARETPSADAGDEATGSDSMPGQRPRRPAPAAAGPARPAGGDGTLARRREHEGQGRQPAGHGPHQRRQPADGDAEQEGPFGVLGRGPHGDAGVGAAAGTRSGPASTTGTTATIRRWLPVKMTGVDRELHDGDR